MTRIRFHIGAHKTATTHLQMTLAGCRFAPGTRYVPLKRLRMTLISPVRKHRPRLPWHRWHGGTWLFSDENILGTADDALGMYPEPARALRYFLDCELEIFLCVRGYDAFLAAVHGETLWRNPYRPFDAALPSRRWPDVIRDLRRDLPGVPVHVWRYEDYRENARAIMRFYADDAISDFGPPLRQDPKSGFSARAVEEMARFIHTRPRRDEVLRLREAFPVGTEYPRFDPWSAEQRAQLQAMYAEDLAVIDDIAALWTPAHSPKR